MDQNQYQSLDDATFEEDRPMEYAGRGKRFLYYIIDLLSFYAFIFGLALFLASFIPDQMAGVFADLEGLDPIVDRIGTMIFFGIYISVVEAIFKGKTLGKLLTKSRAVNEDGSRISTATAFKRGFSRIVPFELLSALVL